MQLRGWTLHLQLVECLSHLQCWLFAFAVPRIADCHNCEPEKGAGTHINARLSQMQLSKTGFAVALPRIVVTTATLRWLPAFSLPCMDVTSATQLVWVNALA